MRIACFLIGFWTCACMAQVPVDAGQTYLTQGDSLYFLSDYPAAEATLKQGLTVARNTIVRTKILNSLGNVRTYMGKKEEALTTYFDAINTCRNTPEYAQYEATIYKNIAALYQESGDYPKAFEYMHKAEDAGKIWNDSLFTADLFNNKGLLLEYVDSLPQAAQSYRNAFALYEKLGNDERLALCANNLGVVYKNLHQYDIAITYYDISLNKAQALNNTFLMAANHINLGNLMVLTRQDAKAQQNLEKGWSLATAIKHPDLQRESLDGLANYYETTGNYKKALHYRQIFQQLSDSLLNKERIDAIADAEARFNLQKKEFELTALSNEKKLLEAESQKKTLYILLLILASALLIIGVLIGRRMRNLRIKKRELELISLTEKQERDRIAQDMHDELGSGISRINWITGSITQHPANTIDRQQFVRIEEIATQLASNMRSMIWLLYSGDCPIETLAGRIREMVSQLAEDYQLQLKTTHSQTSQLILRQNAARDVFLILKECAHNIAKHAQATHIHLENHIDQTHLQWKITDNGQGFDFNNITQGNGLNNLNKRCERWSGALEIQSNSLGTSVTLRLPLKMIVVSS